MICTEIDDFLQEVLEWKATWRVLLSDNRIVIQDDKRPGLYPPQAWLRLKEYVNQNPGIKIRRFWLEFRSHVKKNILPENAEGYFFSYASLGALFGMDTIHFYMLGYLKQDIVYFQKFKVPELSLVEEGERLKENCLKGLILNDSQNLK